MPPTLGPLAASPPEAQPAQAFPDAHTTDQTATRHNLARQVSHHAALIRGGGRVITGTDALTLAVTTVHRRSTATTGPAACISCSYGYDGDRHAFGATVVYRARRQAGVMRTMAADAGDRAVIALVSVAGYMEQSAADVEAQPEDFWVR